LSLLAAAFAALRGVRRGRIEGEDREAVLPLVSARASIRTSRALRT
jgi:hypothetical protein